jgi:hypothetical protein
MCFDYTNVDRPDEYKHKCSSNSSCPNNGGGGSSNIGCDPANGDADCPGSETCDPDTETCVGENGNNTGCSDSACETFQDCPGSIKIKGSYLVALYSDNENSSRPSYCQTFNSDVENLNTEPVIASYEAKLGNVYIIPTK